MIQILRKIETETKLEEEVMHSSHKRNPNSFFVDFFAVEQKNHNMYIASDSA